MRYLALFPVLAAISALAACNSTSAPSVPEAAAYRSPITPPGFKLPEGGTCAGEVARFRAIMENDKRSGHVGDKVFDTIQQEINGAEAACTAGNSAQGISLIHASKVRHGYPG